VIVGGGGHGRVILDCARAAGLDVAGFLDPAVAGPVNGAAVLGGDERLQDPAFRRSHRFIVAIGDQRLRARLSLQLADRLVAVVHPSCNVSPYCEIGAGTVLMPGVTVNANARIGRYCILNTMCSVDHDCDLEDGVQIGPGAHLCGEVRCGENAFVATGALVLPGLGVGREAVIGAGSVVTRDVPARARLFGAPARPRAAETSQDRE